MPQSALEFVQNHERVHASGELLVDQRVRDLVLDVARRDAVHAFARGFALKFLDRVFRVAGQRLAVIQLQFLKQREVRLLRRFQPRQHRPHRGHRDRVRRDVLAADPLGVVVLLVDLDLVASAW